MVWILLTTLMQYAVALWLQIVGAVFFTLMLVFVPSAFAHFAVKGPDRPGSAVYMQHSRIIGVVRGRRRQARRARVRSGAQVGHLDDDSPRRRRNQALERGDQGALEALLKES